MTVRVKIELLGAAVRPEDDFTVVNDRPLVGFGLLPAQCAGGRERKDTHSVRGHSVDIAVWPNRDAKEDKSPRGLHKVPLKSAIRVIGLDIALRTHVDNAVRADRYTFVACAT